MEKVELQHFRSSKTRVSARQHHCGEKSRPVRDPDALEQEADSGDEAPRGSQRGSPRTAAVEQAEPELLEPSLKNPSFITELNLFKYLEKTDLENLHLLVDSPDGWKPQTQAARKPGAWKFVRVSNKGTRLQALGHHSPRLSQEHLLDGIGNRAARTRDRTGTGAPVV